MPRISGFRENHIAHLNVPAENDLHIGLAVFLRKLGKYRLIYQPFIAMTYRIPRFYDRAVWRKALFQIVLLIIWVALDLQRGGLEVREAEPASVFTG